MSEETRIESRPARAEKTSPTAAPGSFSPSSSFLTQTNFASKAPGGEPWGASRALVPKAPASGPMIWPTHVQNSPGPPRLPPVCLVQVRQENTSRAEIPPPTVRPKP